MRSAIVGLLLLAATAPLQAAAATATAVVTFREGRFSEFLLEPDGRVLLFRDSIGNAVEVWENGQWSEASPATFAGSVRHVLRSGERQWRLLALGDGFRLYGYDGSRFALLDTFPPGAEFPGPPRLHLGADGVVWVLPREGVAYGARDGQRFTHAFGAPSERSSQRSGYCAPTLAVELPGRGTWFWSHVQDDAVNERGDGERIISGFEVFRDGQWSTVPPPLPADEKTPVADIRVEEWCSWAKEGEPGGKRPDPPDESKQVPPDRLRGRLGGVALLPDGRLACGWRYGPYCIVSPQDGVASVLPIAAPPGEYCLFLHATPAGRLLTVTAPAAMWDRSPPTHGGRLGTLLSYDGTQTRELLSGVDCRGYRYDSGRPLVDTPAGTFLAAAGAGLVFVPAGEEKAFRLDWRHGVPMANITRLRADQGRLYLLDPERGFAVLDLQGLVQRAAQSQERPGWSVEFAAAEAHLAADGTIWLVTAEVPGRLRHTEGQARSETSLAGSSFRPQDLNYLTTDTRGRVWLIGGDGTRQTALLEDGRWRSFSPRETAYSTIALEEKGRPDFRVGAPSDSCYPVFPGDGRVAYRNEWSRVCFFDGKATWDSAYETVDIDGHWVDGPPFYVDGVLTAKVSGGFYQRRGADWVAVQKDVTWPYGTARPGATSVALPRSFPGGPPQTCRMQLLDTAGTLWAGTADRLWRGLADTWVEIDVRETPLSFGLRVESVLVDRAGGTWFNLGGGDYTLVAHYQPPDPPAALAWAEEPPASTATDTIALKVRGGGPSAPILWAWCLDAGEWQFTKPPPSGGDYVLVLKDLRNGPHVCRLRAHDALLRATPELVHRFRVQRDTEREVNAAIAGLQAASYAEREDAARVLRGVGPAALPALRRGLEQANPDALWWFRAVIEELERPPAPARGALPPGEPGFSGFRMGFGDE